MSDTYDEMEQEFEKVRAKGGRTHVTDDECHPQQDMGKFADLASDRLANNSPEHYETPGDEGDDYKRHVKEREIRR